MEDGHQSSKWHQFKSKQALSLFFLRNWLTLLFARIQETLFSLSQLTQQSIDKQVRTHCASTFKSFTLHLKTNKNKNLFKKKETVAHHHYYAIEKNGFQVIEWTTLTNFNSQRFKVRLKVSNIPGYREGFLTPCHNFSGTQVIEILENQQNSKEKEVLVPLDWLTNEFHFFWFHDTALRKTVKIGIKLKKKTGRRKVRKMILIRVKSKSTVFGQGLHTILIHDNMRAPYYLQVIFYIPKDFGEEPRA
jgi:hypothetical protein